MMRKLTRLCSYCAAEYLERQRRATCGRFATLFFERGQVCCRFLRRLSIELHQRSFEEILDSLYWRADIVSSKKYGACGMLVVNRPVGWAIWVVRYLISLQTSFGVYNWRRKMLSPSNQLCDSCDTFLNGTLKHLHLDDITRLFEQWRTCRTAVNHDWRPKQWFLANGNM